MISKSRWLLMFVGALVIAGVLSACGGGSSSTAAGPSGQGTAGSSASVAAAPAGGSTQGFCGVVRQQRAVLQGTELSSLLTGGSPAAWRAYLDKTSVMNQQLVDAAPGDIRPSVKTLQAETLALRQTLAAAGYDVSKVGSAKLMRLMQSTQRQQASAALVAYVKAQCGLDLTKVGS